ncbi:MAG: hypothetical protein HUU54_10765 [Ignavibacteriaceae bacterium]|nr:hypothetical protein [Ignavibacteriaceae bacterium]
MINRSILFFLIVLAFRANSQVELVPLENPVYIFLKQQYIKGNLDAYDDIIVPHNRYLVENYLQEIDTKYISLSLTDKQQLDFFDTYFQFRGKNHTGVIAEEQIPFFSVLYEPRENHFINYQDSLISFRFDPRASLKAIRNNNSGFDSLSGVMQYGGKFILNYEQNLAFELDAWNGNVYSARSPALAIKEVSQSLTFNKTGINNFDGTSGYIHYRSSIFNLHFGRNRILWGRGEHDKLTLGGEGQIFDYFNFNIGYKNLRYTFLHGWLVVGITETYPDSINKLKLKLPKHVAVSRLGYSPSRLFGIGVAQSVIYGGRPFEAAYLNPFLFWESAQRSLNDIDNSFLTFDISSVPVNGLEVSSTLMLDDIHFGNYFSEGFDTKSNRSAVQVNLLISNPLLPAGFDFFAEYTLIRPYTLSHPGFNETTAYTNNGYKLGASLEPNSVSYTIGLKGFIFPRLLAETGFRLVKHGANVVDSSGTLIRNVGGDIRFSYDYFTPASTPLLDGELEITRTFFLKGSYYLSYNLTLSSYIQFSASSSATRRFSRILFVSLSYGFL